MTREEKKKLRKEYEEFRDKDPQTIFSIRYWYYSIIASLIIFLLPTNILSEYPILRHFTQFMGNVFPNIHVYAQRSEVSELTEFYFSYMWLVGIVMVGFIVFAIPQENEEVEKYLGTGKYKGRGRLNHKYLMFVVNLLSFKGLILFIVAISMFGFGIHANYTGWLIDSGVFRLRFSEVINTRLGMFFMGNMLQTCFLWALLWLITVACSNTIQIQKIKRGESGRD